ncbi:MAG: HlyC/CorC family transporter [Chlamydiales bacterium]|nr:HlyC/CorC family transporter [Chlamydiales bacterium]
MLTLILYFAISHLISFLCSIFEAVLLSCTEVYVSLLQKRGSSSAAILAELKGKIDRPLAAILTLNTISHTIGAAGVGASIVELFGARWLALGSIILTATMLFWTEMLPKTIGALYWKSLAPLSARPIKFLIFVTYPFVLSFNLFAKILKRGKKHDAVTEDDILAALETGAKEGMIEVAEQDMVENVFRLGDRRVGVLMRPRVDIEWLDVDDSQEEIRDQIISSRHHRFPVCRGDIDNVIGIVYSQDLLERTWKGEGVDISELALPPLFVNENKHVFELVDLFRKERATLALVTDEYGSIQGMVTTSDIMNAIVRGIEEEGPSAAVKIDARSWVLEGSYPIDEFKENFHFETLPEEERARYRTLSGLCMYQLGRVPKKGDTFNLGPYRFEIVKVKRRRVEKILLTTRES